MAVNVNGLSRSAEQISANENDPRILQSPSIGYRFRVSGCPTFQEKLVGPLPKDFHRLQGTRDGQPSRIFRSKCSERRVCSFSFLPQLCYVLWLQHSQWRTPQPQMRASSVSAPTAVTLRVFRANDKMSAKEPVSVTSKWDPIPSIMPIAIPRSRRF
jgi:hypothetical protein